MTNRKRSTGEEPDPARVAVVTPVYKLFSELTENELKALTQIKAVLNARDIFLIHPPHLDVAEYIDFLLPLKARALTIGSRYFGNLHRSNRLFVSYKIYNCFADYDYMLIHHTDAFVFSDQLDYWCSQGYDYIGAPWFEGNNTPVYPLRFKGVGNGGLSLRKISSFRKITRNRLFVTFHRTSYKVYDFLEGDHHLLLRKVLGINMLMRLLKPMAGYEDEFWGLIVPRFYKWFRVAAPEQALKFSFEVMPRELSKLNNNELPFGCHAWEKYDPAFWEPYIHPYISENNRMCTNFNSEIPVLHFNNSQWIQLAKNIRSFL